MLTVIIVSYNSDKYLNDCLDSIVKFNDIGKKLQIIVVDNAKSSETNKLTNKYNDVTYIENDNSGFGSANNVGALHANNEYLLFLNPDTILTEPIFDFATKQFLNNDNLRAFGMLLVDEHGTPQETFGFFPEKFKLIPERFYLPLIKFGYTPSPIFPWGANLFVRKADFFKAGMFDENIFMCHEEPDLLHRLPKGQVRIFQKKIIHKAGHSNKLLIERYRLALKSERYYFLKHKLNYEKYVAFHKLKLFILVALKKLLSVNASRETLLLEAYKEIQHTKH